MCATDLTDVHRQQRSPKQDLSCGIMQYFSRYTTHQHCRLQCRRGRGLRLRRAVLHEGRRRDDVQVLRHRRQLRRDGRGRRLRLAAAPRLHRHPQRERLLCPQARLSASVPRGCIRGHKGLVRQRCRERGRLHRLLERQGARVRLWRPGERQQGRWRDGPVRGRGQGLAHGH